MAPLSEEVDVAWELWLGNMKIDREGVRYAKATVCRNNGGKDSEAKISMSCVRKLRKAGMRK